MDPRDLFDGAIDDAAYALASGLIWAGFFYCYGQVLFHFLGESHP